MIHRTVYPKSFQNLWGAFDSELGAKGSKFKAYREFMKQKILADDTLILIDCLEKQQIEKMIKRNEGVFVANFPHVERWLKYRGWEDDETMQEVQREQPHLRAVRTGVQGVQEEGAQGEVFPFTVND